MPGDGYSGTFSEKRRWAGRGQVSATSCVVDISASLRSRHARECRTSHYEASSASWKPALKFYSEAAAFEPQQWSRSMDPDAAERYALFRAEEILRSTDLRRLEPGAEDLGFHEAYEALVPRDQWYLERRNVNQPQASDWAVAADFWCSSDSGKICFVPVSLESGQYHKPVGEGWRLGSPGNVGGFHGCCIDTGQVGSDWTLVARVADFGLVLDRAAGLRVEFAALVRDDCESLVASLGSHDECRALFRVAKMSLPSGRVLLLDPADLHQLLPPSSDSVEDGPAVPSGLGAGYYPVVLSRDAAQQICRISLVFHPTRASKISRCFPPQSVSQSQLLS